MARSIRSSTSSSNMALWRRPTLAVEDRALAECRRFVDSLQWNEPAGRWGYYVYCTFDDQDESASTLASGAPSIVTVESEDTLAQDDSSLKSGTGSNTSTTRSQTSDRSSTSADSPDMLNTHVRIAISKLKSYIISEALYNLPAPYNSAIASAIDLIPIRLPGATVSTVRDHFRSLCPYNGSTRTPRENYCLIVDNESLDSMLCGTEMVVRIRKRGRWKTFSGTHQPEKRDIFIKVLEAQCDHTCRGIATTASTKLPCGRPDPGAPVYHDWIEATPWCLRQLWSNSISTYY